jgi:diguanylate cyclase (GGDEF)-like protein
VQEQRARIQRLELNHPSDIDAIFDEFELHRATLENNIKLYSSRLQGDQLIDLYAQLIDELEKNLSRALKIFIDDRIRTINERANQDPVTGLLNRAAFDQRLIDEVERARRYRRELSVALLDVDCFKSVNDGYGHPVGDQVLSKIATLLKSSLRQSDATFRYGGDEFAAICPETSGGDMKILLSRIEMNFQEYCATAQIDPLTGISWGVASLPADASEAAELIQTADKRLYECKKAHHSKRI